MPRLLVLMLAILVTAAVAAVKRSTEDTVEKECGNGYACVTPLPPPEEALVRFERDRRISKLMSVPSGRTIREGATIVRNRPKWLPDSITRAVVARREEIATLDGL